MQGKGKRTARLGKGTFHIVAKALLLSSPSFTYDPFRDTTVAKVSTTH